MFGSALALGGGAVVSGLLGYSAATKGAEAQAGASRDATAAQMAMYNTTRNDLAPYRDAGTPALQKLMYLTGVGKSKDQFANDLRSSGKFDTSTNYGLTTQLGVDSDAIDKEATRLFEAQSKEPGFGSLAKPFGLQDFQEDPGYQFRKSEGEKAIQRGALARGMDSSSATMKSLIGFNSGIASDEFNAAYGRDMSNKSQQFNLLSYLAGTGSNAAAMTGTAGTNAAAGASQAMMAGGAATAQGYTGAASAINNAIQGGMGNYMYMDRYNQQMNMWKGVFSPSTAASQPIPPGMGM